MLPYDLDAWWVGASRAGAASDPKILFSIEHILPLSWSSFSMAISTALLCGGERERQLRRRGEAGPPPPMWHEVGSAEPRKRATAAAAASSTRYSSRRLPGQDARRCVGSVDSQHQLPLLRRRPPHP